MRAAGPLRSGLAAALTVFAAFHSASAQEAHPAAPGLFTEPAPLVRLTDFVDRKSQPRGDGPSDGFFVDMGSMVTGSGWIAAGPGYRRHLWNRRALFTASGALSWRFYTEAQARIEVPETPRRRTSVGARVRFEDSLQLNYFGPGNHSNLDDRTGFRLRTVDLATYGTWKIGPSLKTTARVGWLGYADVSPMAGRRPDYPDIQQLFTEQTAPGLSSQPDFLHADLSLIRDTRDEVADTSRGTFYRATAARYVDRDTGHFTFNSLELEAAAYVTAVPHTVVIAGHAWAALTGAADGHDVPFYLMPNLGGKNTLRGFSDYRFADRDMETFSVESRLRVYSHLDVAVFVDTGKVASHVGGLGLTDLHSDVGFGLRFRTEKLTLGRLDVATGVEGWHILFKMNEPFRRHDESPGFVTVAPFVP